MTMKFIKLFENFESGIFDSAAIESLNKKLYDEISEGSEYMSTIIEDWTLSIFRPYEPNVELDSDTKKVVSTFSNIYRFYE